MIILLSLVVLGLIMLCWQILSQRITRAEGVLQVCLFAAAGVSAAVGLSWHSFIPLALALLFLFVWFVFFIKSTAERGRKRLAQKSTCRTDRG